MKNNLGNHLIQAIRVEGNLQVVGNANGFPSSSKGRWLIFTCEFFQIQFISILLLSRVFKIFSVLLIISLFGCDNLNKETQQIKSEYKLTTRNTSIYKQDLLEKFTIKNNSTFTWHEVEIRINDPKYLSIKKTILDSDDYYRYPSQANRVIKQLDPEEEISIKGSEFIHAGNYTKFDYDNVYIQCLSIKMKVLHEGSYYTIDDGFNF